MNEKYNELRTRLGAIHDLMKVGSLLDWDTQVLMPRRGAEVRAEQSATIDGLAHQMFTSPEIGRLLDALEGYEASMPYDSDEASLIRVTRSDYNKLAKVPAELRAEMTRAESLAHHAWAEARAKSDF